MKYTFTRSEKGTHTRIADGVRGFLREYPDTVNVQGPNSVTDPDAYALWQELVQPIDLGAAKEAKRQELAAARYAAVNGGTVFNGIPIRTDDQTRTELSIARQFAKENPALTVQWKLGTGNFVTLDAATLIAISNAVLAHQQAQFTKERDLAALADAAANAEELTAVVWG
jgi:hypothetical protein